MEQENIEDVIRIDREVIDDMMEVFKFFNYDMDNFNSKKTEFKNRCDIQEECSELLSEYGFILAKNIATGCDRIKENPRIMVANT